MPQWAAVGPGTEVSACDRPDFLAVNEPHKTTQLKLLLTRPDKARRQTEKG